ncbi:GPO family capsid scaffolding protein [Sodalis endosymbiont of Spalangia cameroni]|uniref:GPO family capsid scaffolding protein n=1 Tax=Sodalis praecaptivus TaxID=1239307 RepID=UPI0031F92E2E
MKSQFFRVAVEGATSDGRTIERQHIQEMADAFDPAFRPARANLEHIDSLFPDSIFKSQGDVLALKAEEIADGPLKGKLALLAQIDATDDLVALNQRRQKIYTSIEYYKKFADTGKAYLTGIAFTDNPASLGSEMMMFGAQHLADRGLFFGTCEETHLAFEAPAVDRPGLFTHIAALFGKKSSSDDQRFDDVHQAVTLVAEHQQGLDARLGEFSALPEAMAALQARQEATETALDALTARLGNTDRAPTRREPATGGKGVTLTDC